jgi:hypothetical protein
MMAIIDYKDDKYLLIKEGGLIYEVSEAKPDKPEDCLEHQVSYPDDPRWGSRKGKTITYFGTGVIPPEHFELQQEFRLSDGSAIEFRSCQHQPLFDEDFHEHSSSQKTFLEFAFHDDWITYCQFRLYHYTKDPEKYRQFGVDTIEAKFAKWRSGVIAHAEERIDASKEAIAPKDIAPSPLLPGSVT